MNLDSTVWVLNIFFERVCVFNSQSTSCVMNAIIVSITDLLGKKQGENSARTVFFCRPIFLAHIAFRSWAV